MAPIRGRVLSANSPGVLALSQGRADLFALRPPWCPFATTRPQIYADSRKVGTCRRITLTCSGPFAVAAPTTRLKALPLRQGPMRRHPLLSVRNVADLFSAHKLFKIFLSILRTQQPLTLLRARCRAGWWWHYYA